jgi:excisionase family DNA binding protein
MLRRMGPQLVDGAAWVDGKRLAWRAPCPAYAIDMRASSAPQQRHASGPDGAITSRVAAEQLVPGQARPAARQLDGPLLRPEHVAALLSVKTSWVYDAVRTGKLPCIRVGRHIRFTRGMLEEWLSGR